jgi:adenosylcobinamide kinase / adenosylcobinamide-phosphate guanylyltransferase
MRELILGGQKSGKSRLAEERSRAWLAQSTSHRAVLIATGLAHDEQMCSRIARHQADRLIRLPALQCVEEPRDVGARLQEISDAQTLVMVDCLTMWLTNLLMPFEDLSFKQNEQVVGIEYARSATELIASALGALAEVKGPVVLVSNEIGLGVIPLGAQVRHFVDELGKLNQAVANRCERVTLMAAGCALTLKGAT